MRPSSIVVSVAVAAVLSLAPMASHAQYLATGRDWQRSSLEERRAYLMGISNSISVGARYDLKAGASDSFSQRAQRSLANAQLGRTVDFLDAHYRNNPSDLDKPVISVLWREVAKQTAYSK